MKSLGQPFLLIFAYGLTQGFVIQMVGPIFPLFLYEDLNVQVSQVGIIVAILSIFSLVGKIPLGIWIRPKHLIPSMLLGSAIVALMPLAYALSPSTELVVVFRVIHGLATAVTITVNLAVVTSVVKREYMQRAVVIYSTSFSAGLLAGPLAATFLVPFLGIRYSLAFSSTIALIAPFVGIGFLKYRSLLKDQPAPERKLALGRVLTLVRSLGVAVPSVVSFAHSFLLGTMLAYGSLYAKIAFKLEDSQITLLFFGLFTVSLVARLGFTKLLSLIGKAGVLTIGLIAEGLSIALVGTITLLPLFIVSFVAFGIAHGLIFPTSTLLVADSTSVDDRTLGNSIFLFSFDLGQLAGPLAIASMIALFGIGHSISFASAIVLLGLLSVFYLHRSKTIA